MRQASNESRQSSIRGIRVAKLSSGSLDGTSVKPKIGGCMTPLQFGSLCEMVRVRRSGTAISLLADRRGATAIEYGLLVATIALGIGAGGYLLGFRLSSTFGTVGEVVAMAGTPVPLPPRGARSWPDTAPDNGGAGATDDGPGADVAIDLGGASAVEQGGTGRVGEGNADVRSTGIDGSASGGVGSIGSIGDRPLGGNGSGPSISLSSGGKTLADSGTNIGRISNGNDAGQSRSGRIAGNGVTAGVSGATGAIVRDDTGPSELGRPDGNSDMGRGNLAPGVGSSSGPSIGAQDRTNSSIGNQTFRFADSDAALHGGSFNSGGSGVNGRAGSAGGSGEFGVQSAAIDRNIATASITSDGREPDGIETDRIWSTWNEASEALAGHASSNNSTRIEGGNLNSIQSALEADTSAPQNRTTSPTFLSRFLAILLLIALVAAYRFQRQRQQENDDALAYRHRFHG